MGAAFLIQNDPLVTVVTQGVFLGNNLDRVAADCGTSRKTWLRYRSHLSMNAWLFSRLLRQQVAQISRHPTVRMAGTIDNGRQDETPLAR